MGTISTGTGLISGLDIQGLVRQLMAIESRPLQLLQQRIAATKQQQTAYLSLSATLLAAKTSVSALSQISLFNKRSATSSDTNVLTATAASGATVGTASFTVRSLVSTQQLVSSGFRDHDSARLGAGELVFETARANVAPATSLAVLNNGAGVRRGVIRITDRSGASADVDLTAAATIDDVLEAINNQSGANVRARIEGDRLVIEDLSGGSTSDLRIADLGNGMAAADLGIAGAASTGTIAGKDLVSLSESTRLSRLNDGIGVRFSNTAADLRISLASGDSFDVDLSTVLSFETHLAQLNDGQGVRLGTIRITNRAGESADVDLSGAETIQDVTDAIAGANIGVTAPSIVGSSIVLMDSTGTTTSNLKIEDVSGHAAADLGIVADVAESTVRGADVYRMDTLGALMGAIQYAEDQSGNDNDGRLSVSLSENGLVLTDNTTGSSPATVTALNDSLAARDLGLLGGFDSSGQLATRNLIAGLNTVLLSSLKGGQGLAPGALSFTLHDGTTIDNLDFSQAQTLSDVVRIVNATGKLSAQVDAGGTRLLISDLTTGSGTLSASGAMADALGLNPNPSGELISGDLQLQYIAETTRLSDLNAGKGISYGRLQITTASGTSATLTISASLHKTVGDVIEAINDLNMGVVARINANGDGIELQDTTTGTGQLTVAEAGTGTTASDLGLLGKADESGVLVGSFAKTIEVSATDTLDSLIDKINGARLNVTASLVNDGTGDAPYRMILTSKTAGSQGLVTFSTDISALNLDTLTKSRDAVVVVGDPASPNAVVVNSSSNTIKDLLPGVTLNLVGTSDRPVQVTVARDVESVVSAVKSFIDSFNSAMDQIDQLTSFNSDTQEKGVLFGESTVRQVQSRLFQIISNPVSKADLRYRTLRDVGIMVDSSSGSARLTLQRTLKGGELKDGTTIGSVDIDGEQVLREAIAEDPDSVKKLFALVETDAQKKLNYVGVAARFNHELTAMTTAGGLLPGENDRLQSKVDQFNDKATRMQALLDMKEQRLYAQFQAMETVLAGLQTQQAALASLTQLASSMASA